jgi:polynucleotide 5'-kinase involved in rRNA processing
LAQIPAQASLSNQIRALYFPPSWFSVAEQVLHAETLSNSLKLMLCGERNAGKSTFARFLVNQLLNQYEPLLDSMLLIFVFSRVSDYLHA